MDKVEVYSAPKISRKHISYEILYFLSAITVSYLFMKLRFILNGEYGPASLSALANNTAFKPAQYRVLIPWIARSIYGLVPQGHYSLRGIYQTLEVFSLFFLIVSFRYYISLFIKERRVSALLSLALIFILPFNFLLPRFIPIYYPYDTPAILFFVLGLNAIYEKKWLWFYPVFIAATLNKESACFLTMVFLITSWNKEKPKVILLHYLAQVAIWLSIKAVLTYLFRNNSGPSLGEFYQYKDGIYNTGITSLSLNIAFLSHARNWPFFLSNMGFTWALTIFYFRLIRDDFVKKTVFIAIPFFIVTMLMANIYEMRVFGELIPVFLMPCILIFKELLSGQGGAG